MNETEGGRERSLRARASGVSLCAWVVGVAWRGMYIGIPRLCPPGSRQGYNETVLILVLHGVLSRETPLVRRKRPP